MEIPKMKDSTLKKEDLPDCRSPSSNCSKEESQAAYLKSRLINHIREKLIRTAQIERLGELLNIRLQECGWKANVLQNVLNGDIRNRNYIKLEEIYELVRGKEQGLVPNKIKEEMVQKIQESFEMDLDNIDESFNDSI